MPITKLHGGKVFNPPTGSLEVCLATASARRAISSPGLPTQAAGGFFLSKSLVYA